MKKILIHERVRKINGGFSYIPTRFLTSGFLESLKQKELLLYLFLVIVSDRNGLSYYSYDRICTTLEMDIEQRPHGFRRNGFSGSGASGKSPCQTGREDGCI
jgi:hypothetical protein